MNLLTPFDPWKSNLCTCPAKYSLSPYTGCGHGCIYCYASSYIINFSHPREKKNFLPRLEKEIKNIPKNSFIAMANSSDPYLPLEKKLKLTRAALKILKNYDLRLMIVTKSDLILRDLDILKQFKKLVISFTLTTLQNSLAKKLEPFAPSPQKRLKAIKTLAPGLPLACRIDPLIYPLNTGEIKKMVKELKNAGARQIITSTYKAKPDNFKRMVKSFPEHKDLWEKLYIKEGTKSARYLYLPGALRKKLIEKVRNITLEEGLSFSTCREGFTHLNTAACDGSSFFERTDFCPRGESAS